MTSTDHSVQQCVTFFSQTRLYFFRIVLNGNFHLAYIAEISLVKEVNTSITSCSVGHFVDRDRTMEIGDAFSVGSKLLIRSRGGVSSLLLLSSGSNSRSSTTFELNNCGLSITSQLDLHSVSTPGAGVAVLLAQCRPVLIIWSADLSGFVMAETDKMACTC